jgi:alpha-D-ribose 1-methylphosphonate 5-triphosphate diphosphatase PhnM
LVTEDQTTSDPLPWRHYRFSGFSDEQKRILKHAQCLSESIQGAAFLYNLLLAGHARKPDLEEELRSTMDEWAREVDLSLLSSWNRGDLRQLVALMGHSADERTWRFLDEWIERVLQTRARMKEDPMAEDLIRKREGYLKGARSRFTNRDLLAQWSGWAGTMLYSYRWNTVKQYLDDLQGAGD